MIGLLKSLSRNPTARSIDRFGARCTPSVISLLRSFSAMLFSLPGLKDNFIAPASSQRSLSPIRCRWKAARRYRAPDDSNSPRITECFRLGLCRDAQLAAPLHTAQFLKACFRRWIRVHILPKLDSAEQSFLVAHNFHVLGRLEPDELAIAAAKIQPVVIERDLQIVDRFAQRLVPPLLALLEQHPMAQLVFVS